LSALFEGILGIKSPINTLSFEIIVEQVITDYFEQFY
jgi:hypothetical protein